MIDLAAIRPDDWNVPLFLHVLGAFTLIGTLVMAAGYLFAARGGSAALTRLGYRSLLLGALPAYILTRGGAEWIASKEDLSDSEVTWIGIGYGTSDVGLLLMIVATVATGLAVRRMAGADAAAGGGRGVTIAAWLVALLIIAYAVAVWAMAAKPV